MAGKWLRLTTPGANSSIDEYAKRHAAEQFPHGDLFLNTARSLYNDITFQRVYNPKLIHELRQKSIGLLMEQTKPLYEQAYNSSSNIGIGTLAFLTSSETLAPGAIVADENVYDNLLGLLEQIAKVPEFPHSDLREISLLLMFDGPRPIFHPTQAFIAAGVVAAASFLKNIQLSIYHASMDPEQPVIFEHAGRLLVQ